MSFTLSTSQRHAVALAYRRRHVKHMHLFGSAVRDDFQPGRLWFGFPYQLDTGFRTDS